MAGTQMQLEDWLDDLCVRFIINLPEEDLSSVARICFQVEEAQWFYEDFIRPLDPTLPSMSLRTFCLRIFQHCPLLANFSVENHTKAFEEFLEYKTRVPVRGAIMLNEAMDSTVLVKGWKKGANWSFPRGKINKDEDDLDCAIREVYEETGLDLRAAGLVPREAKPKYIEISMREQHMRLYVFRDVPMDTVFEPKTRKEISKIQWYKLSELPAFRKKGGNNESHAVPNANKFYMVAPFLPPLKKWVVSQKKIEARRVASGTHAHGYQTIDEVHPEDEWTQTDTGAETSTKTPAIETLAGATQELQRLLKVQPPTQGIQPAPHQPDKGSALLSILQAGPTTQRGTQLPHTPQELTISEAPQPQNPHHQNNYHQVPSINTQQPPLSFPLSLNQGQWNTAQMQPRNDQVLAQQFPIAPLQQYGSNQATLVHPQPLPPQVQRSVFNRSVFQEGSQPNYPGSFVNPQHAQYGASGQVPPGQMPHQHVPLPLDNPRPAQLNGQSMALLNAFKSGSASSQLKENASQPNPPIAVPGSTGQNYAQPYGYSGVPHHLTQTISQERTQPSPKELAGSRVGPSGEDHRSALLGMFRKADPGANTPQAHHDPGYSNPNQGTSGNMLNELLRSAGTGSSMRNHGPSRSSVDTNPSLSLDALSIHSRPMQSATPGSQGRVDYTSQYGSQPQSSQPSQPLRILQRGQNELSYGANAPMVVSPQTSPQEMGGHPPPGHIASPGMMAGYPAQGVSSRRPESGADQKRQLLSLFGKQESPGLEAGKGKEVVTEVPPPRVPSLVPGAGELAVPQPSVSRRGSQTPISPADRSFLLGYLESVTNNATR